jgi:hypothetical protein
VLPLPVEIESRAVLKATVRTRGALAEMKGAALSIPNEQILINTLSLQKEARDNSAIENVVLLIKNMFVFLPKKIL